MEKQEKRRTRNDYQINVTRYWYGPRISKSRYINNYTGQIWAGTLAEAKREIAELDESVYYTAHGESGRAKYTIVR